MLKQDAEAARFWSAPVVWRFWQQRRDGVERAGPRVNMGFSRQSAASEKRQRTGALQKLALVLSGFRKG